MYKKPGLIAKFLKRLGKLFFGFVLITALVTTAIVMSCGDDEFRYQLDEHVINDVTALNPIGVHEEIAPVSLDDLINAVRGSSGPISIGGGRYSQGGQTAYDNSLHIDMRRFNQVLAFDKEARQITLQPGITWRSLQQHIDPHNLSIRIMQTYANFTVGGSLSVNVHGRYIGEGPLVHSVISIKLVLADGSLVFASPTENSELFYGAIGGYGGLGVIVEATLSLTENTRIERRVRTMAVSDYAEYFAKNIRNDPQVVFHNADIYPPNYQQTLDVSWYISDRALTIEDRLIARDEEYYWGPKGAEFVANYDFGKKVRQHLIDPAYYAFDRVVWRNWEASYDVRELEPADREEKTYVLREYFIPVDQFDRFVPTMAKIFRSYDANIINVSVRHAHKDPGTLLAWARNEMFAFVVYYQQGTDRAAMEEVRAWSTAMIDAVIDVGGTYYLPYQIFATPEQFRAAYPDSPKFFALKKRVDPEYRFRNRLWRQHYPGEGITGAQQARIENYNQGEERTFLTIPEWYLVFNPLEYADFLEAGKNPSDFPFFASINEYWKLYDRVRTITVGHYPANSEYLTMLRVIGISTTTEYMYKGIYEQTLGRFTRWASRGENTPEDVIIGQAHRAYSDLIFDKAWYEFEFSTWLARIWSEPDFFGPNFIRKLERKLFFSLEFGFKALYAKLIGYASQTAYEASDGQVYLTAKIPKTVLDDLPDGVNVLLDEQQAQIVSVPRWGGFTRIIPHLVDKGVQFFDISGNEKIAVSFTRPANSNASVQYATKLFSSQLVSDGDQRRSYAHVRVDNLHLFLAELNQFGYRLEHIYDY